MGGRVAAQVGPQRPQREPAGVGVRRGLPAVAEHEDGSAALVEEARRLPNAEQRPLRQLLHASQRGQARLRAAAKGLVGGGGEEPLHADQPYGAVAQPRAQRGVDRGHRAEEHIGEVLPVA